MFRTQKGDACASVALSCCPYGISLFASLKKDSQNKRCGGGKKPFNPVHLHSLPIQQRSCCISDSGYDCCDYADEPDKESYQRSISLSQCIAQGGIIEPFTN